MRDPEELRAALRTGPPLLGVWASIPTSVTAEVAAAAGRRPTSSSTTARRRDPGDDGDAAGDHAGGAAPLVRVARNDPWLIGNALDLGALGVIVPMVDDLRRRRGRWPPAATRRRASALQVLCAGSARSDVRDDGRDAPASSTSTRSCAPRPGRDLYRPSDLALSLACSRRRGWSTRPCWTRSSACARRAKAPTSSPSCACPEPARARPDSAPGSRSSPSAAICGSPGRRARARAGGRKRGTPEPAPRDPASGGAHPAARATAARARATRGSPPASARLSSTSRAAAGRARGDVGARQRVAARWRLPRRQPRASSRPPPRPGDRQRHVPRPRAPRRAAARAGSSAVRPLRLEQGRVRRQVGVGEPLAPQTAAPRRAPRRLAAGEARRHLRERRAQRAPAAAPAAAWGGRAVGHIGEERLERHAMPSLRRCVRAPHHSAETLVASAHCRFIAHQG